MTTTDKQLEIEVKELRWLAEKAIDPYDGVGGFGGGSVIDRLCNAILEAIRENKKITIRE